MRYTAYPKWLDPDAEYTVSVYDTGETFTASGKELVSGGIKVKFKTSKMRASQLIFIEKTAAQK